MNISTLPRVGAIAGHRELQLTGQGGIVNVARSLHAVTGRCLRGGRSRAPRLAAKGLM